MVCMDRCESRERCILQRAEKPGTVGEAKIESEGKRAGFTKKKVGRCGKKIASNSVRLSQALVTHQLSKAVSRIVGRLF